MTEREALHLTYRHIRAGLGESPARRAAAPELVVTSAATLEKAVEDMREANVDLAVKVNELETALQLAKR